MLITETGVNFFQIAQPLYTVMDHDLAILAFCIQGCFFLNTQGDD